MTLARQVYAAGVARLTAAGIPDATRDARRLFDWASGQDDALTRSGSDDQLPEDQKAAFVAAITRRCAFEPVSHILGYRDFWGRRFQVGKDVLDPRPETETLVAFALSLPWQRVLDLGVGSGAILVSLLADRAAAQGVGVDASAQALAVAQRNLAALDLTERGRLIQSDWFAAVEGRFDLVVSNPPYLTPDEWQAAQPELRQFEPYAALVGGADGLDDYRRIVRGAPAVLNAGGALAVEIGITQGHAVAALLTNAGFGDVTVHPDVDHRPRVVSGIWKG